MEALARRAASMKSMQYGLDAVYANVQVKRNTSLKTETAA